MAAKDFVGWSGLLLISILFEYVMGIKSDPVHGKMRCAERISVDEEPCITIEADRPVEVKSCWENGRSKLIKK